MITKFKLSRFRTGMIRTFAQAKYPPHPCPHCGVADLRAFYRVCRDCGPERAPVLCYRCCKDISAAFAPCPECGAYWLLEDITSDRHCPVCELFANQAPADPPVQTEDPR